MSKSPSKASSYYKTIQQINRVFKEQTKSGRQDLNLRPFDPQGYGLRQIDSEPAFSWLADWTATRNKPVFYVGRKPG